MQAAEFARERLRALLPRLQARAIEVAEAEEFAHWLPQQQAAEANRDKLAVKLSELYLPFVDAMVPLLHEIEKADHEIWQVNQAAPYKAKCEGYFLHTVEEQARGPSARQLRDLQIMKHLRLPNWEGSELPVWPPHRPPDPAVIAPMLGGDPRLYTDRWQEVQQEQAQAAAELIEREERERQAKTLENYHGPQWWETERT
jgi:hypothetical protein